jgi:hypothetical protein
MIFKYIQSLCYCFVAHKQELKYIYTAMYCLLHYYLFHRYLLYANLLVAIIIFMV